MANDQVPMIGDLVNARHNNAPTMADPLYQENDPHFQRRLGNLRALLGKTFADGAKFTVGDIRDLDEGNLPLSIILKEFDAAGVPYGGPWSAQAPKAK